MLFHVLTLFPEAFVQPLKFSIIAQACRKGLISIEVTNIRDFAHDNHSTADDYQFGGGHGMVMKAGPVFEATEAALDSYTKAQRGEIPIVLLTPQGEPLTQKLVEELSAAPALTFICGHYAGVDERVPEGLATRQISIGDFVLTGGELAAMVLIDAVSRLIPGVVGSPENVSEDSITSGLLQHPLYTRPAEFRDMEVPEVLRSGNHKEIDLWRRRQSLKRTLERRPDLLRTAQLTQEERDYLSSLEHQADGQV